MDKKLSFSQTLLALAIAFLAFSLFKFTLQVPPFIEAMNKTTDFVDSVSPQIDKIVDEVALVRVEVGKVRELIAKQTPDILTQVQATMPVVQEVITESKVYSKQIPQLLAQLTKIEQQIDVMQSSLPSVLQRVDAVVKTTNNTTAEIALWRPQSIEYLKEIKLSRIYIPEYLTRVQNTVNDAKTIGSEASSGIVSGFFKGVIKLPMDVVSGVKGIVKPNSKSAKNLTANDVVLMQAKIADLLSNDDETESVWQNSDSGNSGTIVKGKTSIHDKKQCIELTLNNYFQSSEETLHQLMCLNEKGIWQVN
ncbi:hypothetical protein [Colwellia echini]|uniref:Surface antigen domain-containing protein n=1 Tax=Colwellia echini TaxID=1982103 RepID=A0ABY3MVY7_9GAMM|nr:hypothetical protein [Colwellia echini]TYK65361.1 hypothetical protein CWS31_010870 [Colwellia echini]